MKTALISGANGGLGRLLCERLLNKGWRVFAGLRHPTAVTGLPVRVLPLALDLEQPAWIDVAVDELRRRAGRLDALVHCAGLDQAGAFEDLDMRAWRQLMEVNFFGPVALTRAALPLMRTRKQGVVVALSSLSGLVGLPGNSAYAAAKFALEGAFESLRHELKPFGIGVALVEPGAYATGMAARYLAAASVPGDSPYAPLVAHCLASRAGQQGAADPSELADYIVALIEAGAPQLRHPVGQQAARVAAALKAMDDAERERFVAEVSGQAHWAPLMGGA